MKLKLVNKRQEARNTISFFFEPESKINYLPGQFYYFTLPKLHSDPHGVTRPFTLSSSPTEGEQLQITTRIRKDSLYKQTLAKLTLGETIEGDGPGGTFIADEKEKGPHIFLAGGIGITPYRSIIKYALDKGLETKIALIYSNKTPQDVAFYSELKEWARKKDLFSLYLTITRPKKNNNWNHLTGRIDEKLVNQATGWVKSVNGLNNPTYWICGPPVMVNAIEALLLNLKIKPSQIRTERFSGY